LTASPVSADGTRNIVIQDNNIRSVKLEIDRITNDTSTIYVLVCSTGATNCTVANRTDSQKVLRYDCIASSGPECNLHGSTVSPTFSYPFASTTTPVEWRPNSPSNSGPLAHGEYRVKVIIDDEEEFSEIFSFPQFAFTTTEMPVIQGTPRVGSTLQLTTPTWTPAPAEVTYVWMRCSQQVADVADLSQLTSPPYTVGYESDTGVDCRVINENGTVARPPLLEDGGRVVELSVRAQSTAGFTSYTLRDQDVGSFIAAREIISGATGIRDVGVASTPIIKKTTTPATSIIETKTVPVNQVLPKVMLKKTKKIKKVQVGATITVDPGTWKWSNSVAYQWYRCTTRQKQSTTISKKRCTKITRATKASYTLKSSDRNRYLVVQVTARNELGATTLFPASTAKAR
jgi:hypothetical protein